MPALFSRIRALSRRAEINRARVVPEATALSWGLGSAAYTLAVNTIIINKSRNGLQRRKRRKRFTSEPHDVVAAVHVEHFARDAGTGIRCEKDSRAAHFFHID